jgi:tetratricopeptide (TPR) repeat protein
MYGQYYQLSGQVQKAEDSYLKSLAMDSLYNPSRINLGILYNQLGRNQEAINMYKTIIQLEPDYGPAYYSLGLLMGEEGRLEESLEYLQKAVLMMADNPRVYYNLGIVNQNLGKTKDAEKAYLDGLNLVLEAYYLRRALIILYLQQNDFKNAGHHIDILLKVFPNDPELLKWKGMVY